MKFTLSWLKEFLDTNASVQEISETLTAIGLEVEEVQDQAAALKDFTVAEILAAEKHPDADRLQVCKVLTHDGERQIVCGAPNARAGIKVALADIGVVIPNGGFTIKKSKIRGVESCGMLCSADELGIGSDAAGIIELPDHGEVGRPVAPLLGKDDVLIEIAITPDRGDCLGVYGIARDLAAAGLGTLKDIKKPTFKVSGDAGRKIQIKTDDCKFFAGRLIQGVENKESPDWLKQRLESIGLRPISVLVDITNYMTMAYGRPLHVYDADKLSGDIIVRASKKGEEVDALNDKQYKLPEGLCVIADEQNCLGLGGVVGGVPSGCTEQTTNVFLESAWFEPEAVAKTGRELMIDSDARYRFERTVDPEFTAQGAEIATALIIALCGGEASEITTGGTLPDTTREILFDEKQIKKISGIGISSNKSLEILRGLGFTVDDGSTPWKVTNPSYRPDMQLGADVVEEILRIHGYDQITEESLPLVSYIAPENEEYDRQRNLRNTLANRGLMETYHFAFISEDKALKFNNNKNLINVINPISQDMGVMRPSLIPGLLFALKRNHDRGKHDTCLYEIGTVFEGTAPNQQPLMVAGVRSGANTGHWSAKPQPYDVYDVKHDLEIALKAVGFGGKAQVSTEVPDYYHPGKSGCLKLGKQILGYFGTLHPAILRLFDIEHDVQLFEAYPDAVPTKRKKKERQALKVSDYQATKRDFAFIVEDAIPAEKLLNAVRNVDKTLIQSVELFDVYTGKGVPEGSKSLAISVTLQAQDRTLEEQDIQKTSDAIISAAAKQGASLR